MSNNKPSSRTKTQLGHVLAKKPSPAFDDTLPAGQKREAVAPKPDGGDLMTSAPVRSIVGISNTSGAVTLSGERVAEPLARELIDRSMAREGIALRSDHAFCHDDLLVTLDGYDPERKIGYQFVSHADADVVTDFDPATEQRLRELSAQGLVRILIIHDYEACDGDAVLERVEAFLSTI